MSVILEYAFRSRGLVLADALAESDVRLEVERITAPAPDQPVLFVWIEGTALDTFHGAVREDPTVTDIRVLSEVDDERLYSMRVTSATEIVIYPEWVDRGGEGLQAYYEDDWWHSRLRFPDRAAASSYRDALVEKGVEFRLERLYDTDDLPGPDDGLTPEQRETLQLAYERGYFSIPRGVTTAELAEELGVSDQAVSERLRRGYARLVQTHLRVDAE